MFFKHTVCSLKIPYVFSFFYKVYAVFVTPQWE